MAIKKFNTRADYNAATKSTTESTVSLIVDGNETRYDGVNVLTKEPICGDLVYLDDTKARVYVKRETYAKAQMPSSWVHVGYVGARFGSKKLIFDKAETSLKYLAVSQFAWTDVIIDGERHEKTIGLRFGLPTWDTTTQVVIEYNGTSLAEVANYATNAIEAKLSELGAPAATIAEWWAYADTENNRIIIQRDNCTDYRFYNCSGLTHITWGDMPENSNGGFRAAGLTSDAHIMNDARGAAYYGTNGRVPTENVPLKAAGGIVKKADFDSSAYCKLLRDTYGTYQEYIKQEFHVVYPQQLGVHGLPSGKELMEKYGSATAPTKAGGTLYKFPALHYGTTIGYTGCADMVEGKWWLPGVFEGCTLMDDDNLAAIADAASKASASVPNNTTSRWFAQRYGVHSAWFFSGGYGYLGGTNGVPYAYACRAVTLCDD